MSNIHGEIKTGKASFLIIVDWKGLEGPFYAIKPKPLTNQHKHSYSHRGHSKTISLTAGS